LNLNQINTPLRWKRINTPHKNEKINKQNKINELRQKIGDNHLFNLKERKTIKRVISDQN